MKYRRLDKNSITIYFSERDIDKYNIDFSVFLTPNNQQEAQDLVYRLLKEVDDSGDFTGEQQLSIQMFPTKSGKGFLLNVRKFDLEDAENPEALIGELLQQLTENESEITARLDANLRLAEELMKEDEEDEKRFIRRRTPLLIAQTPHFEDIVMVARLKQTWAMTGQRLYYANQLYTLVSEYPKGTPDKTVDADRLVMNEYVKTSVVEKKQIDFDENNIINKGVGDQLMHEYARSFD